MQEVIAVAARRDAKCPPRDHYLALGVEPSASSGQITSAYRRLVRMLHPDANPAWPTAWDRFAEAVAYATLRNPRAARHIRRRVRAQDSGHSHR
jgi:curved DNA-binding protein CbpA